MKESDQKSKGEKHNNLTTAVCYWCSLFSV